MYRYILFHNFLYLEIVLPWAHQNSKSVNFRSCFFPCIIFVFKRICKNYLHNCNEYFFSSSFFCLMFFLLTIHHIGFFKNFIMYSCMRAMNSNLNMFSENWKISLLMFGSVSISIYLDILIYACIDIYCFIFFYTWRSYYHELTKTVNQ